ncbi:MAG: DUF2514 domain-containing protein [Burkholderiaceae bacterium]|jgi:hypothetical protein|nr:DUF2514 domain-containing protein [Burkholderiaceae bacterium]
MTGWLIPALAAGAVIVAGAVGYNLGGQSARAQLQTWRAQAEQAASAAQARERQIETQRNDDAQKIIDDAQKQRNEALAHAVAADKSADGLRQRLAALASAYQASIATAATGTGAGINGTDAIHMLSDVLERVERDGRSVAGYADQLKITGSACERQYDAVREAGQASP